MAFRRGNFFKETDMSGDTNRIGSDHPEFNSIPQPLMPEPALPAVADWPDLQMVSVWRGALRLYGPHLNSKELKCAKNWFDVWFEAEVMKVHCAEINKR